MKKTTFALAGVLVLAAALTFGQQTAVLDIIRHHDHTLLMAMPTSTADALVPSADAPSRVIVKSMYFVNTNSSTERTVTVTCKTTGTILVEATIPGVSSKGNNIPVQFPADGISCQGGVRWLADGAGVNGYMTGVY